MEWFYYMLFGLDITMVSLVLYLLWTEGRKENKDEEIDMQKM